MVLAPQRKKTVHVLPQLICTIAQSKYSTFGARLIYIILGYQLVMKKNDSKLSIDARIKSVNDELLYENLNSNGSAVIKQILSPSECHAIKALYQEDQHFRNRIIMAKHGYGRGEYRYFSYPLPELVEQVRTAIYPVLVPIANKWNELMKIEVRYPEAHSEFLQRCHGAGQIRPTPLILQYEAGDFNCLHQDLYGEHVFPLQLAILLSEPNDDFEGGEFVMTEQRPRMQSRPIVVPLKQGDGVVFAVHQRPVKGTKGVYRVNLRHGVSQIIRGHRHTLGIIFHDAK